MRKKGQFSGRIQRVVRHKSHSSFANQSHHVRGNFDGCLAPKAWQTLKTVVELKG